MNFTVNFYCSIDNESDSYEEILGGIQTDNIMYLTAQVGDSVIVPTLGDCEYFVDKVVKKFYNKEIDIYISKAKYGDEFINKGRNASNGKIKDMFGSLKDAKVFDFSSSFTSCIINPVTHDKNKDLFLSKR